LGIKKRWQDSRKAWRNSGHREKQPIASSPSLAPWEGERKLKI
jgi:hypothetical protein